MHIKQKEPPEGSPAVFGEMASVKPTALACVRSWPEIEYSVGVIMATLPSHPLQRR